MTTDNGMPDSSINGLEAGQDREAPAPRTADPISAVVGDAAPAAEAPAAARPLEGVVERRWRRRRDLNSIDGVVREHARLIAAMHNNRVPLERGEILSRAYARHREMVAARDQIAALERIQTQLEDLRTGSAPLALPDIGRTP